MPTRSIAIYSRRGQEVVLVLYALQQLGGIRSKQEVLRFIREKRFYDLQEEDMKRYDGHNEWIGDTLLCFARKDAVENEWMFDHDENDSWELTRPGHGALDRLITRFRSGSAEIHRCFLWRQEFKLVVDPSYVKSVRDWTRPERRKGIRANILKEL